MIARDKQLHIAAGIILALPAICIGWIAFVLPLIGGIGKEVWDAQENGTPDKYDALATVLAGLVTVVLIMIGRNYYG